jgi:2-alkyl-3-oxoalkanoate reductase
VKVFIVGATGVLGKAVVPKSLSRGDSVVALVRSLQRAAPIAGPGVELHEGDLLTETPERLRDLLAGCDAAAHLATALRPGSPGLGTTNTNESLRVQGTRRLLDALLVAGVPRYVQQSIAFAYADRGEEWLDELTPLMPGEEGGGISRPVREMEDMVRALDSERIAWTILRGGSFVGRHTREDDVIERLHAGTLKVPGDGDNWVSLIHVDDYAQAVVDAIHSSVGGAVFNITDEPLRYGAYLDRLAAIVGAPRPERDPLAPRPRSFRCTNAAARAALDWSPSHGIWPMGPQRG